MKEQQTRQEEMYIQIKEKQELDKRELQCTVNQATHELMIKLEQDKEEIQLRVNETTKEEADKIFHKLDLQEKTWQDRHKSLYELGKEIYLNQSRLYENQKNIKQVIKNEQEKAQDNLSNLMFQEGKRLIEDIRKETDESRQLIKMENQIMISTQVSNDQKQEERYEGEVAASQILFLAGAGLMCQIAWGTLSSQIPGNACQVECSRPKSCRVPSSPYVAVASARPSNCGNILKPHLPSTESERDGSESTMWPS
jgi:hypothetical protein